jgi:raffinose/stachyose/melibiose transport system substrate-binding protein
MKKAMKLVSVALVSAIGCSSLMFGCSGNPSSSKASENAGSSAGSTVAKSSATLSVYSDINDEPVENALKKIVSNFEAKNPSIKIDLNFPGSDYENILKVKMASNTLPDVFDTHGWAKIRYGKYLADLKDCSWASNLTDAIKDVVTDSSGKVYCLPMVTAMDGFIYNADMLKKYNIAVPKTVDELTAAAVEIKAKTNGTCTPFFMSGVDSWSIAQYYDVLSTPLLISPSKNYKSQLLNNTFDWSNWTKLPQTILDWKNKGLINTDVLTAKNSDLAQRLATGKTCFDAYFLTIADQVKAINPDVHLGIMPCPTFDASDTPSFSGGERYTMGIWKDTQHMDACKTFLDFVSQSSQLTYMVAAAKEPSGIKGVKANNEYQTYFDKYSSSRVFPYFDRVYIQNGMWDVMCKNGTKLLAGQTTPSKFSSTMKSENDRLAGK